MSYLRNTWYMGGWSDEVAPGQVLARTFLDEPVALFRTEAGVAGAVLDQCPHRFAPLSAGAVQGEEIICGYHGLGFGLTGRCSRNPHGRAPNRGVRSFPVVDAHKAIWIWFGDKAADPSLIPDLGFLAAAPATAFTAGHLLSGGGNYQLYVDNIMDLSHVDYLHPNTLGGGSVTQAGQTVLEFGDEIEVTWLTPDTPPPPLVAKIIGDLPERMDAFQRVRWSAPSVMRLVSGILPMGGSETDGILNTNAHVMTPETETSTHYFFAATRNFRVDDDELNAQIGRTREMIFRTEDKPMIEKIAQRMGDREFWSMGPMMLSVDGGSVRVRRKLEGMIAAEAAHSAGAAGQPPAHITSAGG